MKIDPQDIRVRLFTYDDIEDLIHYFYHSPPGFIESLGLNLKFFGSEEAFRERYQKNMSTLAESGKKPSIVTVYYKQIKVGFHTSTHHIPEQSLNFHAHFFNTEYRKKGIGTISLIKASDTFLREFKMKKIFFKVPIQNKAPMRVVEKLGLTCVGEEVLDWPQLIKPQAAKVFSVDAEVIKKLKIKFGIQT